MKLRWKILVCFVTICGVVLPWPLFAAVCAQRVVKRVVTYAQPVVAYQQVAYQQYASPYSYAIGSDLVLEALAEKLALRIEQKLVQKQQAALPQSISATKCARCHMPNSKAVLEEEAVILFDKTGQLIATPEQRAVMEFRARQNSMPPPPITALDDNEYLALVQELKAAALRDGPQPIRDPRSEPPPSPNGERRAEPVPPPAPTPQGP